MGMHVERIRFENGIPPLELVLRRIAERTSLKVKCSIRTLLTVPEVAELAKNTGHKIEPTQEILTYWLEHPKYQGIVYWPMDRNGKQCIEFQTGAGFRKTLMAIVGGALISLGGEWDQEDEMEDNRH